MGFTGRRIKSASGQKLIISYDVWSAEVDLLARSSNGEKEQCVAKLKVNIPILEPDAEAKPTKDIHPVDLDTIFVPHIWFLLPGGQIAEIEIAALNHSKDLLSVKAVAWYESLPLIKDRL
jgi:hypothetical protein